MGKVPWLPMQSLCQQVLQLSMKELLELLGGMKRLEVGARACDLRSEIGIAHHTKCLGSSLLVSTGPHGLSEQDQTTIVDTVARCWSKARQHRLLAMPIDDLGELVADFAFGLHALPLSAPASLRKDALPSRRSMR